MYVKFTTVYNAEIKYTETYQSGDIPIYGQIVINQNVLSVFFLNIVLLIKQVLTLPVTLFMLTTQRLNNCNKKKVYSNPKKMSF